MTITDDEVELAVHYLRDTAPVAAKARAERLYLEAYLKVVKAERFASAPQGSVADREADALTSDDYRTALEGYRQAVEADEKCRFLREAASAKLEAWRTWSANERGVKL